MRSSSVDVVDLALAFPGKSRAVDLLRKMALRAGVDLRVLRGRVTESEARYEVRMRGIRGRIEKAVRLCAARGAENPIIVVDPDQLDQAGGPGIRKRDS